MSSVTNHRCPQHRESDLDIFRELFFPVAAEAIFFGIYLALAVFSSIYLMSKKKATRQEYYLLTIIGIMFAVAVSHWTLHLILGWFFARHMALCMELPLSSTTLQIALSNIQIIDFTISDFIVVWRGWLPSWRRSISSQMSIPNSPLLYRVTLLL
ncbi:hypothetical protein OF83DRAFT_1176657 [Amylostereum chailletii]|nr:hypothetical protein OF83DRAFT_1176657 [Amylostereum chailletii]